MNHKTRNLADYMLPHLGAALLLDLPLADLRAFLGMNPEEFMKSLAPYLSEELPGASPGLHRGAGCRGL